MKVGDIVSVHDGSYSLFCAGDGKWHTAGSNELSWRAWRVIGKGLTLPADRSDSDTFSGFNDIMLCERDRPVNLLFTQERFCTVLPQQTTPSHAAVFVPAGTPVFVPEGAKAITITFT